MQNLKLVGVPCSTMGETEHYAPNRQLAPDVSIWADVFGEDGRRVNQETGILNEAGHVLRRPLFIVITSELEEKDGAGRFISHPPPPPTRISPPLSLARTGSRRVKAKNRYMV